GAGDVQRAVLDAEGQNAPGADGLLGNGAAGAGADAAGREAGARQALLEAQRVHELLLGDEALVEEEIFHGGGSGTRGERLFKEAGRAEAEELENLGQAALV